MKTRKTVLLAAIGVLLCIYIVQLITSNRPSVKQFKLDTRPDTITLASKTNGTISLNEENGAWVVGDKKYPADTSTAESLIVDIQNIKSLSTVSHSVSDGINERYGLDKDNAITVTASKDGKQIRMFTVGKAASTGSQTYIRMENSSDTLLASGNIHDDFAKTVENLRGKEIYTVNSADITEISVELGSESYKLAKTGDPAIWSLVSGSAKGEAAHASAPDTEKIASWISQIANLKAQSWGEDNAALSSRKEGTLSMKAAGKTITVSVTKEVDGDDVKYLCSSSETKYPFYLSSYAAARYTKKLGELKK